MELGQSFHAIWSRVIMHRRGQCGKEVSWGPFSPALCTWINSALHTHIYPQKLPGGPGDHPALFLLWVAIWCLQAATLPPSLYHLFLQKQFFSPCACVLYGLVAPWVLASCTLWVKVKHISQKHHCLENPTSLQLGLQEGFAHTPSGIETGHGAGGGYVASLPTQLTGGNFTICTTWVTSVLKQFTEYISQQKQTKKIPKH